MAKPVQQLGKSPLRRINPAAPMDSFKFFPMRGFGDLRCFAFGAVIAPQIIFTERLKIFPYRNN